MDHKSSIVEQASAMPPTVKAGTAWGATGVGYVLEKFGFHSWGDLAAFLAAIYSLILICEWAWKKWRARK